ncbi:hypothetical protein ABT246_33120 [Streptomyces sp. NPDC001553]|uniref:hypothetical protein n=1 Tax=Streptomyces sp. NPDC001553 TaxID=3154385 RepID=UPI00331BA7B7
MEPTPEQQLDTALLDLARLRACLAAGLPVEQAVRLQGSTDEELAADAVAFAAEMNAGTPVPPSPRSGGARGSDVGDTAGTPASGAARYRARHNLDEDGRRPERAPAPISGRNAFTTRRYEMER